MPRSKRRSRAKRIQSTDRMVTRLDTLALHRIRRDAIVGLQEHVNTLEHLVGLVDHVAMETFPYDPDDELRGAVTMMRAAVLGIMEASIDIGIHLGMVRFASRLDAITFDGEAKETR